jgi:hypothetical protein
MLTKLAVALKNHIPVSSVNRGDKELMIPFNELLRCVSENANKNAGNKLPNSPVRITNLYNLLGMVSNALGRKGNDANKEMPTRVAANSCGEKTNNAFLIRIYDDPHIRVRKKNIKRMVGENFEGIYLIKCDFAKYSSSG